MGQENQPTKPENPARGTGVLHRKVATGLAEHQARAMSLPKALRLTLAKTADDLFDLAMAVLSLRRQEVGEADLEGVFDPKGLLVVLDGPEGRRAAAVLDGEVVGALIQQQTMGQVLAAGDGEPRRLTATDAAICAPFVDGMLQGIEGLPDDRDDVRLVQGYRFGAHAEDLRQLLLTLEAARFEVFQIGVDIANGTRQGQMAFCFPVPAPVKADITDRTARAGEQEEKTPRRTGGRKLAETVLSLQAELSISLARVRVPLHKLGKLKAGDLLELKSCDFEKVDVMAGHDKRLGQGVLGQIEGTRAVQLIQTRTGQSSPKRRATDREDLDLPDIGSLAGDATQSAGFTDAGAVAALSPEVDNALTPAVEVSISEEAELPPEEAEPDMVPDMSDLPGFEAQARAAAG